MGNLHKCFESTLAEVGFVNAELPTAVFYRCPVGLRFEIGGKEDVYLPGDKGINPAYVQNAFYRAKTLFYDLPCQPELLRIDSYPEETDGMTDQMLKCLGLPVPDECVMEKRKDEEGSFLQEHLYWNLTEAKCHIDQLLLEIIKGDIGGFSCLTSSVYFLSTECPILYHLYDDRGTDIVTNDKKLLMQLYRKYNDWILPYDKDRIRKIFTS